MVENCSGGVTMNYLCRFCGDEVYGDGFLTNGLCLNCYYQLQEESRLSDIEAEHDYYEGYGII